MSNEHPTYPNPTIIESVCDIHFRLPQGQQWKSSLAGELFKHIQNEYPEMEPVLEMGLQLEVGPTGAATQILPQSQKFRFKHKVRPIILQLAENSFSISTLPPYQGWEVMRNDILAAWEQVIDILAPEAINRMGLRYINRFMMGTPETRLGEWLRANYYIPNSILHSKPGFFLREQVRLDTENVLIITLGDAKTDLNSGQGAVVFDIDRIVEKEMSLEQTIFQSVLEQLHTDVWDVFSSSKGEKLESLLRGNSDE